jgi:hypothetical protein
MPKRFAHIGILRIMEFTQPDTIIPDLNNPQALNRYAYANNNPIRYADPSGHDPWDLFSSAWRSFTSAVSSAWNWFTGRDVGYTGSGWGHGPRRLIANMSGAAGDKVSSLGQTLRASLRQEDSVQITGQALSQIACDPALVVFQNEIIAKVHADPGWYSDGPRTDFKKVTFGGPHDDWGKSAGNGLTWMVRAADVNAVVSTDASGGIRISYSFSDTLDLRPSPTRSRAHNAITRELGFLWHEALGGNDKMKVKANWQYYEP